MGTLHVREMTGGLDARRLPETTPGGVLIRADNGHITRGGEFQSRYAFVPEMMLPASTVGLAHTRTGLVTFGSGPTPVGLPLNVRYMQLPSGSRELSRIVDWELFEGKLYVVAEYQDGAIVHFYDGVEVSAWEDARARVTLQIDGGNITPAQNAQAQFEVTGGTDEVINYVTSIQVSGTELLSRQIFHTGDNAETAAIIAADINDNPTTPTYEAVAVGSVVQLTTGRAGAAANGRTITWEANGNFTIGNTTVFSGGADRVDPQIDLITIGGVPATRYPIPWTGDVDTMAEAVADAIMDVASDPEYEATANGASVIIKTTVEGAAQNGRTVLVTKTGDVNVSFPSGEQTAGGKDLADGEYLPADLILTVREKMYAGAGSLLHYSAVQDPTVWVPPANTGDPIGAGFTNIAASNSSSYRITGLSRYYDQLAVFTPDTVQTWFIDPDPDLFIQTQVLENTGTECPGSVTQFGDSDIFYLDSSGLRSLRSRDSSNAAATTDIGVPIDDLLVPLLRNMSVEQKLRVTGLINPTDKRFWLIIDDQVFVYSYYPNSKINAWTRYELKTVVGETERNFSVDTALVFDRRVFIRSMGNTVYCYGGWNRGDDYDDTPAVAWLPMLDADAPAAEKDWTGLDVAASGRWDVNVAWDPTRPEATSPVANLTGTTYGLRRVPMKNRGSHVGLRFTSRGGPAVLSALVVHFDGKVNED